jgi:hypothetical protein
MCRTRESFDNPRSRLGPLVAASILLLLSLAADSRADTIVLTPLKDNRLVRCSGSGTQTNYGGDTQLWVRSGDGNWASPVEPKTARSLLQFDLCEISQPVSEATLALYYFKTWPSGPSPAGRTYQVRRCLNEWVEGTGTQPGALGTSVGSSWENADKTTEDGPAVPWQTRALTHIDDRATLPDGYEDSPGYVPLPYLGGGDFPYTDCLGVDHWGGSEVWATAIVPDEFGWMQWDVTGLVQAWLAGQVENHGLVVLDSQELWHPPEVYDPIYGVATVHGWGAFFYSKEYADADYRPYLKITTVPEPGSSVLLGVALAAVGCLQRYGRRTRGGQRGL